ncbi:porin [Alsobacter metallidurans]|uniref:Porin n=1 Tax=Alsobacter metallidurans TaxID=340221 RepID=A0A917I9N7_9HYPH|nr:outer membrane protein [Alsobacter metallidurans]GGH28550.1 porin [Alsobacter metallidurans]
MSVSRTIVPVAMLLALAATGRAQAADLPSRRDPYVATGYAAPVPTWQGLYAGVHAGGGFGKAGPTNTSGLVAGGQVGYNLQMNNFVAGVEADLSASGIRNNSYTDKTRQKWLGSARARVGYAVGNVLPYVTGGVAMATTEIKGIGGKSDGTHAGYAVGAGAEMMMSPNVTVRAEYLHYGLGDATYPSPLLGPVKVENSINVIRAGANYKF